MTDVPQRYRTRILSHRRLSTTGYELTLERKNMPFTAGRLLTIHGREVIDDRSYTIAGGESDEALHVLYRLIPGGRLTPWLVDLKPGDPLDISGPFGEFVIRDPARPIVFIAT
ncbi:MAG: FAD-binding oxidoreductase, partial [Verrucomicrobiota bacterium]